MKDGGLQRDAKGFRIDSMNTMMTQLRCSKQGQLDDNATQYRSNEDHESMSTRGYLMTKIDMNKNQYGGEVVP